MGYTLGVDFGSMKTTVAMVTGADKGAQMAVCGTVVAEAPSVVFLGDGGEVAIGRRAEELGLPHPHLLIRDFKRRLGDSVPVVAGVRSVSAESMVTAMIGELIDGVVATAGASPEAVTVTYPATWGPYKQTLLSGALDEAGLADFELVSEPAAAARNALGVDPAYATVIVYDLGGTSFDVAVLRRSAHGEFEIAGRPQVLDGVGGADFDQAIFSYVQHCTALGQQDVSDPAVLAAMRGLRAACRTAKEALSHDTEVTIPVNTPYLHTRIRLVRSEFEELICDAVEDTLAATHRCMSSAGLTDKDIDAIVLVGGSSQIPLVAQLISAEFELPLITCAQPGAAIALGAAQFGELADLPEPVPAASWACRPEAATGWAAPEPVPAGLAANPKSAHAGWATPELAPPSWSTRTEPAAGWDQRPAPATVAALLLLPPADSLERLPSDDLKPALSAQIDHLKPTDPQPLPGNDEGLLPGPSPMPVADGPAENEPDADQRARGGRHRVRGRRRYWVRTTGIVASVCVVLLLGSSVVASKASETRQPDQGSQVQVRGGSTSQQPAPQSAGGSAATGVMPPSIEGPGAPGQAASGQPVISAAVQSLASASAPRVPETEPAAVNAPAVVIALAEQGDQSGTALAADGAGVTR